MTGSLTIVGTGIKVGAQLTLAAKTAIEKADTLLFSVSDPVTATWLKDMNPTAEPLYSPGDYRRRRDMYQAAVARILEALAEGGRVCAAFYGHPGVFADPPYMALRAAREHGFEARMLPGVSAEDCLYADLEVDPGMGFQSFEVSDFLIRRRRFDPHCPLLLWQIAVIGNRSVYRGETDRDKLRILCDVLEPFYRRDHEVVLYEAAIYAVQQPAIDRLALGDLPEATIGERASLYVPPIAEAPLDDEMVAALGLGSPE